MDKIKSLAQILEGSNNIVFFGGAGVSTESNIPDFRSNDGIYQKKYDYPPEVILSHNFFISNPKYFYKFYKEQMIYPNALPNKAHKVLTLLEEKKKLKAIITQNIDSLHQEAGSKNVFELHGSIKRNYCMKCKKFKSLDYVLESKNVPYCECGGLIKPDVVLYNEPLDDFVIDKAIRYISTCDTLIVGGTSLTVYPASGFINYFSGKNLVIINKSETAFDSKATLVINDFVGEVLSKSFELMDK